MRPRMAVGRCCCKGAAPPPQTVPFTPRQTGYFVPAVAGATINSTARYGRIELGVGTATGRQSGFLWWGEQSLGQTGIDIPQGATINSAKILINDLVSSGITSLSTGNAYLYYFPAALTPPPPVDGTYFARCNITACLLPDVAEPTPATDLTVLPRTSSVAWQLGCTVSGGSTVFTPEVAQGAAQETVDIAAVVQEVVDQPTWVSGNNMMIFYDELNSDFNFDAGGETWGFSTEHGEGDIAQGFQPRIEIAWS